MARLFRWKTVKACILVVFGVYFVIQSCGAGEDRPAAKIDLGGPRKVVATIAEQADSYRVSVSFLPVRSFDRAMNRQLTRDKARTYAIAALTRHLKPGGRRVSVIVRNVEIIESRDEGPRAILTLQVPRSGITVSTSEAGKSTTDALADPAGLPSERGHGSLLQAKDDYLESLQALEQVARESMPAVPKDRLELPAFYEAVSVAEVTAIDRFDRLCGEIGKDRLLLSIERDDLVKSIGTAKDQFLVTLRGKVVRAEELESDQKEPMK